MINENELRNAFVSAVLSEDGDTRAERLNQLLAEEASVDFIAQQGEVAMVAIDLAVMLSIAVAVDWRKLESDPDNLQAAIELGQDYPKLELFFVKVLETEVGRAYLVDVLNNLAALQTMEHGEVKFADHTFNPNQTEEVTR